MRYWCHCCEDLLLSAHLAQCGHEDAPDKSVVEEFDPPPIWCPKCIDIRFWYSQYRHMWE